MKWSRLLAETLKNELQCDLTNAWILCGAKSAKVSVANSREVINSTFVIEEVNLVEDVEELTTQLQFVSLSYRDDLRQAHVPLVEAGESQAAFSDVTERVLN